MCPSIHQENGQLKLAINKPRAPQQTVGKALEGTWLVPSLLVMPVFCQLDTARVMWEEGMSIKKRPPSNWPEGKPVGHFLD